METAAESTQDDTQEGALWRLFVLIKVKARQFQNGGITMKKETFLQLVKKHEIPLKKLAIVIDEHIRVFPAVSVYQAEGLWVVSKCNNERSGSEHICHVGDEDGAFECVWKEMMFRLTCDKLMTPDLYHALKASYEQIMRNQ